jgi:hypothetical protein
MVLNRPFPLEFLGKGKAKKGAKDQAIPWPTKNAARERGRGRQIDRGIRNEIVT